VVKRVIRSTELTILTVKRMIRSTRFTILTVERVVRSTVISVSSVERNRANLQGYVFFRGPRRNSPASRRRVVRSRFGGAGWLGIARAGSFLEGDGFDEVTEETFLAEVRRNRRRRSAGSRQGKQVEERVGRRMRPGCIGDLVEGGEREGADDAVVLELELRFPALIARRSSGSVARRCPRCPRVGSVGRRGRSRSAKGDTPRSLLQDAASYGKATTVVSPVASRTEL
ncbi:MAG: hypothetical protein V3T72_21370, partial [Thermoanaerobaculia bacterium]